MPPTRVGILGLGARCFRIAGVWGESGTLLAAAALVALIASAPRAWRRWTAMIRLRGRAIVVGRPADVQVETDCRGRLRTVYGFNPLVAPPLLRPRWPNWASSRLLFTRHDVLAASRHPERRPGTGAAQVRGWDSMGEDIRGARWACVCARCSYRASTSRHLQLWQLEWLLPALLQEADPASSSGPERRDRRAIRRVSPRPMYSADVRLMGRLEPSSAAGPSAAPQSDRSGFPVFPASRPSRC